MAIELFDYQEEAIKRMHNGCILCGGVGSGKSITALAYYFKSKGGCLKPFKQMTDICNLYIITTAKKRDSGEWEADMLPFQLTREDSKKVYKHDVVIDSWNNIGKYVDIQNSFFILDEQRLVSYGAWTKSFLKIARNNNWILLSATPGDTWSDYMPVFIANGFYKNKTEFTTRHIVWNRHSSYPQIDRYLDTGRLIRLRNLILVNMDFERKTVSHHEDLYCEFDSVLYKSVMKSRANPETGEPFINASGLCQCLRKIANSDASRIIKAMELVDKCKRAIIFYNYDYELDILKDAFSNYADNFTIAEWNGHKHQEVPDGDNWVYLVQYNAGNEGWNCIRTDTIIFYSNNYSYKVMTQAAGRIDRLNTPYTDLYYYHLKSRSSIDFAIDKALRAKKNFNEGRFASI